MKKILKIERDRLNNFSEAGESNKFFFQDINYDKELLRWKKNTNEEIRQALEIAKEILEKIEKINWTKENLEKVLLESAGEKRGDLLFPLRACLTGEQKSPSPFECAWVIGKNESLKRIENAIALI